MKNMFQKKKIAFVATLKALDTNFKGITPMQMQGNTNFNSIN